MGSTHRVDLRLPAKAAVSIEEGDRILIAPFVLALAQSDEKPKTVIDVQLELTDYLAKLLRKKKFDIVVDRAIVLPSANLDRLKADTEFWKETITGYNAKYALSGTVDFRVEDRSNYETEEFVSAYDKRTYLRQILVEKTGLALEILLYVIDAEGTVVKELPLKTFMDVEARNYDQLQGFFETIYPMEESILNLFVPHKAKQRRYLFGF